jgi:transposase-like protein
MEENEDWCERLKERVDAYFKNTSDEQIRKDITKIMDKKKEKLIKYTRTGITSFAPKCPYCGHQHFMEDPEFESEDVPDYDGEAKCHKCERVFTFIVNQTFTTYR